MAEHSLLQSSTRRNSLTSLSTANSYNTVSTAARSMSTEHLTNLDDKFVKKSIKKLPTSMLNPGDKFHKTNTGTYYFPNGEVFRPRMTPAKRHRPGKVPGSSRNNSMTKDLTAGYTLHYTPSPGTPEIPRSSSMVSMQSANSSSSAVPNSYISKSSSFTNLKRSNKQNLAQSLRSNKVDTPTNINIQNLAPVHTQVPPPPPHASSPNLLSPPVQNMKSFQASNVLKDSEGIPGACKISDNIYTGGHPNHPPATNINQNRPVPTSSDSNLSSLSNYNLNRSSSNTPQTSINTSIDIEEAPEGYVKCIKNIENRNIADDELQKSSSLESIKETELHSIEEVPRIDVHNDEMPVNTRLESDGQNKSFERMRQPTEESTTYNRLNQESNQAMHEPCIETPDHPVDQSSEENINDHFEESTSGSIQRPQQTSTPMGDEILTQGSTREESQGPNDDAMKELFQPAHVTENNFQVQDLEQGSEESDIIAEYSAESESDSESEVLKKIPKPSLGMIEANDSSEFSQEDLNRTHTQMDSDTEDLSTLHDVSEDKIRNNSPVKNSLVFEYSNSDDFQTPEGSPVPEVSEWVNGAEKDKNISREEELSNINHENASETRKDISENDNQSTNIQEIEQLKSHPVSRSDSPRPESPKPKNFFDFHKDDAFDRFLNDNQVAVPPRGDVAVVGDKIRKHERSVSSISSFNSILHSDFESPNKTNALFSKSPRQNSPRIPHSHSSSPEKGLGTDHKNQASVEEKALPITPTEGRFPVQKDLPASPKDRITLPNSSLPNINSAEEKCPENHCLPTQVSEVGGLHTSKLDSMPLDSNIDKNESTNANKTPLKKGSMLDVVTAESKIPKKKPPSDLQEQPSDKAPLNSINTNKVPKVKSFRSLNEDSKLKKSSSTANFKAFFKKLFPLPSASSSNSFESKSMYNPKRPQTDVPHETSSFNKPKKLTKGKRSFSFANLKLAGFNNKSYTSTNETKPTIPPQKEAEEKEEEAVPKLNVLDNENIPQTESLTITKLPTIERDDGLFEDMFINFDERFNRANSTKSKAATNSINELFIKDDELTRDQIEDQQKKDNNQISDDIDEDNDAKSTSSEAFSMANSEEIYIDDNIRYLQDELIWPVDNDEFTSIEDYSVLSRSGTVKTRLNPENNEEQGESTVETIVVDNEQLTGLFDNLSELQRRRLPIHLKHIGQFKDSKILEISIRKFESIPDLSNLRIENKQLNSILKKLLRSSENKKVQFSNKISINETFSPDMYKRYNKSVTQYTLTESMEINKIKNELNTYKCNEMLVHEHSQDNTHFFY